jgi:hypothetical protein
VAINGNSRDQREAVSRLVFEIVAHQGPWSLAAKSAISPRDLRRSLLMVVAGRWLKTLGEPTFLSKIKELPV